jgi:hypothetical protein
MRYLIRSYFGVLVDTHVEKLHFATALHCLLVQTVPSKQGQSDLLISQENTYFRARLANPRPR